MRASVDIAIVGGGCSGALAAAQLLRHGYRGTIAIVEPRERLGRGLAYSTGQGMHLLNVAAAKMSALPDQPSHYLDWLRARGWPHAGEGSFTPRSVYGEYVQDLLRLEVERATGRAELRHLRAEAVEVKSGSGKTQIALRDGGTIEAGKLVLALGNPASSPAIRAPSMHDEADEGALIEPSPWMDDGLTLRSPGERFLLLGSGLTAVDATLSLLSLDADSQVTMASRRGILPQAQCICGPAPELPLISSRAGLGPIVRELRGRIETLREMGHCWRVAIDALRPDSNRIWNELSVGDQRVFLRHLRPYWEPHRHRMAPQVAEQIGDHLGSGRLSVIAARVVKIERGSGSIRVRLATRGLGEQVLEVDRIINCTGLHENYANSPRPLVRSLIGSGEATANALGLGFDTDSRGALIDRTMKTSEVLFTLGPPRRGGLFETTAVPEIRLQAEALAIHLVESQMAGLP